MADLTHRQLALGALAALLVVVLGLHSLHSGSGGAGGAPAPVPIRIAGDGGGAGGEGGTAGGRVVVHVAGAVHHPGVYRLRAGARVEEAVRRAGGATRRADLGGLNLAAKAEDGRQVLVPRRGVAAATAGTTGAAAPTAPAAPVNLNTATAAQLDQLAGVGPATAQKIIDYREQHGGFGSVEELGQVPGIGDVRLAALRDLVTV